ncbi:hypothetical protein AAZX31_06G289600 [Glycine max]
MILPTTSLNPYLYRHLKDSVSIFHLFNFHPTN